MSARASLRPSESPPAEEVRDLVFEQLEYSLGSRWRVGEPRYLRGGARVPLFARPGVAVQLGEVERALPWRTWARYSVATTYSTDGAGGLTAYLLVKRRPLGWLFLLLVCLLLVAAVNAHRHLTRA